MVATARELPNYLSKNMVNFWRCLPTAPKFLSRSKASTGLGWKRKQFSCCVIRQFVIAVCVTYCFGDNSGQAVPFGLWTNENNGTTAVRMNV